VNEHCPAPLDDGVPEIQLLSIEPATAHALGPVVVVKRVVATFKPFAIGVLTLFARMAVV